MTATDRESLSHCDALMTDEQRLTSLQAFDEVPDRQRLTNVMSSSGAVIRDRD